MDSCTAGGRWSSKRKRHECLRYGVDSSTEGQLAKGRSPMSVAKVGPGGGSSEPPSRSQETIVLGITLTWVVVFGMGCLVIVRCPRASPGPASWSWTPGKRVKLKLQEPSLSHVNLPAKLQQPSLVEMAPPSSPILTGRLGTGRFQRILRKTSQVFLTPAKNAFFSGQGAKSMCQHVRGDPLEFS